MLMRCTAAVPKDSEICTTYGELSNAQLLSRYGFVEAENRHDTVLLPLGPDHPVGGILWNRVSEVGKRIQVLQWLCCGRIDPEDKRWSHAEIGMSEALAAMPGMLLLAARIARMPAAELSSLVDAAGNVGEEPEAVDELIEDVLMDPPDGEEAAAILGLINSQMDRYGSPLSESEAELATALPGSNVWAALMLRCSEGRILKALHATVSRALADPQGWVPPGPPSVASRFDSHSWP